MTSNPDRSWAQVAATAPRKTLPGKVGWIMDITTKDQLLESSSAFANRRIIGWYSMGRERKFFDDRRGLKFYEPGTSERFNKNGTSLKLSRGYNPKKFKTIPDSKYAEEGLKPIHKWIEKHPDLLAANDDDYNTSPRFVTNRHCLKKMLMTPYLESSQQCHWKIRAEKDGERINMFCCDPNVTPKSEYLPTYQGQMFERYLLSDLPGEEPNPLDKLASLNGGFYCVFKARLGAEQHSIVYSAEMDAMLATENVKKVYQRDGSFNNLDLNKEEFVELKTVNRCGGYYYQHRLRHWWTQCSPVGVSTIVCGFKVGNDEVRNIEEVLLDELDFNDGELPWLPEVCNDFLVRFLSKVRILMDTRNCMTFELRGKSVYGTC